MEKMVSEAKMRCNKRYDRKTYKNFTLGLRLEEDDEIIKALESAKANGIPYREVLNDWYMAFKEK